MQEQPALGRLPTEHGQIHVRHDHQTQSRRWHGVICSFISPELDKNNIAKSVLTDVLFPTLTHHALQVQNVVFKIFASIAAIVWDVATLPSRVLFLPVTLLLTFDNHPLETVGGKLVIVRETVFGRGCHCSPQCCGGSTGGTPSTSTSFVHEGSPLDLGRGREDGYTSD